MQEGRRFQRTLPCPDDGDSLASKPLDLPALVTVNCLLRREPLEYRWLFFERANPGGDHYIGRANLFTISQGKPEARLVPVDTQNRPFIEVRAQLVPEPPAIFHKCVQRDRGAGLFLRRRLVSLQGESSVRVGQTRRHTRRTQQHALGHLVSPELHGLTKHTRSNALRLEVNSGRKSI